MKPLRPYTIDVFNIAGQAYIGSFRSNEVPRAGDNLSFLSTALPEGDPFRHWSTWKIDSVTWQMAHAGSVNALEISRESDGYVGDSFCTWIELMVWPVEGLHHWKRPAWAPTEDEDEDEDAGEEEVQ